MSDAGHAASMYALYMQGWSHATRLLDTFASFEDDALRDAYTRGYADGSRALRAASESAAQWTGFQPVVVSMEKLLGYPPSRDQLMTVELLSTGKSAREMAPRLMPREIGQSHCPATEQWTFKVCADLGFGTDDRDCARQGWAAMQKKAAELCRSARFACIDGRAAS